MLFKSKQYLVGISTILFMVACSKEPLSSLDATSKAKIDVRVLDQLKSEETVKVIIRTTMKQKFFGDGQTLASDRELRKKEYDQVREKIVSAIRDSQHQIKVRDLKIINGFSADVKEEAIERLAVLNDVSRINLDDKVYTLLNRSVQNIFASNAWSMATAERLPLDGTGTRIAIIDTGVDYTHPDLGGCFGVGCKVEGGFDFAEEDSDPMDDCGHGTHVAAIAAGNGPYPGVAPGATILAFKVFLDTEFSDCFGHISYIIDAVGATVDPNGDGDTSDRVDVVNMSVGAYGNPGDDLSDAVNEASAQGVPFVAAAGNSGEQTLNEIASSPAVTASAITVAAGCQDFQIGANDDCETAIASFSSIGPVIWESQDLLKPDITAPGVAICSSRQGFSFDTNEGCIDQHHLRLSGTSGAAPHVTGAVAILKQIDPTLTPDEVKQILKSTADPSPGIAYNFQGAGNVNVLEAIQSVGFLPEIEIEPNYWAVNSSKYWVPSNPDIERLPGDSGTSPRSFSKDVLTPQNDFPVLAGTVNMVPWLSINPYTYTQSFTVKGISLPTNPTHLVVHLIEPILGVSFTVSTEDIQVTNNSEVSFSATVSIDHGLAVPGVYPRKIEIRDWDNNLRGSIHVSISLTVPATVDLNPPPGLPLATNISGIMKGRMDDMGQDPDLYVYDHKLTWEYDNPTNLGWFEIYYGKIVTGSNTFNWIVLDESFSTTYTLENIEEMVCDLPNSESVAYSIVAYPLDPRVNSPSEKSEYTTVECP